MKSLLKYFNALLGFNKRLHKAGILGPANDQSLKQKLLILQFTILLFSCEMERGIEYNTHYKGDKLVITGFINASGSKDIYVQKTVHPLLYKDGEENIDSAFVRMILNAQTSVDLFRGSDGFYRPERDMLFLQGESIRLEVTSPGLKNIYSSTQVIPEKPTLDSLHCSFVNANQQTQKMAIQVFYNPDINIRYYGINYKAYYLGRENSSRDTSSLYYKIFSEVFDANTLTTNPGTYLLTTNWRYSGYDSITVTLSAITEDIYHFVKSLDFYESSRGDVFMDPTIVHSNIYGGYGIFGLYNPVSLNSVNKSP